MKLVIHADDPIVVCLPDDLRMIILCYLDVMTDRFITPYLGFSFMVVKPRWMAASIIESKKEEGNILLDERMWITTYRVNGVLHRDDGPAWENQNRKIWYQFGQKHRVGGPAEIDRYGRTCWYRHDKCHRSDGPAFIFNGIAEWYYLHGCHIRRTLFDSKGAVV